MRKANITDYVAFAHAGAGCHPRSSRVVRGIRRRVSRDGGAGAGDRLLGQERLRQDPRDQHQAALRRCRWCSGCPSRACSSTLPPSSPSRRSRRSRAALDAGTPAVISVFAGRIADTGVDPVPLMAEAKKIARAKPKAELLWASPRELLNIFQADSVGCDIITVTHDVLAKLELVGKRPRRILARDRKDVLQGRDRGGLQHTARGTQGRTRPARDCGSSRSRCDAHTHNGARGIGVQERSGDRRRRLCREPAHPAAAGRGIQGHRLRHALLRRRLPAEARPEPARDPGRPARYAEARRTPCKASTR